MATQIKYASSVVSATYYTGGSNAYSSDDSRAIWSSSTANQIAQLVLGIAAFEIPDGSTINSVTAYIERRFSGYYYDISYSYFQIALGATLRGTQFNDTARPSTDTVASTDGGEWTVSELNGGTMRAYIDSKKAANIWAIAHYVDVVYVIVDYTESAGTQYNKALTANVTATASMTRASTWLKALTANITATASMVRNSIWAKVLSASVTASASMTRALVWKKALTANITAGASMVKQAGKNLVANILAASTIVRQSGKNLIANATATATQNKQTSKNLLANVTASASFTAIKVFIKTLIANVTATASMVRVMTWSKVLTATVNAVASMKKDVSKSLTATANFVGSVIKGISKSLSASVSATASFIASRTIVKQLIANVTAAATMTKSISKTLTANVTATATRVAAYASGAWNKVLNKFRLKHYSLRHYDDED